jgi:hypothetical protein
MNSEWTRNELGMNSITGSQPAILRGLGLGFYKGEVFPSAATGVVRLQLERGGGVEIGRISQREHMGPFFFWTSYQNHWNMAATHMPAPWCWNMNPTIYIIYPINKWPSFVGKYTIAPWSIWAMLMWNIANYQAFDENLWQLRWGSRLSPDLFGSKLGQLW